MACGWYSNTIGVETNIYEPAYQKNIGIWANYLTPSQCINYGFNQYFVSGNLNQIESAISTAKSIIGDSPHNIGYYYIDEPWENETYSLQQVDSLCLIISSNNANAELMIGEYQFPYYGINYETYYKDLLQNSNARIMYEQYYDGGVWVSY